MGSGGQDNEENLSNIEEMLGFELTPQQEALFQARDTSAITRGAEQLGQGLLGMTGGQGLASAGTGFGVLLLINLEGKHPVIINSMSLSLGVV